MKAIIEIPDELIRSAGSAIALAKTHLAVIAMLACEKLSGVDSMTIKFDSGEQKQSIEADIAMLCITQVAEEMLDGYERN